MAQLTKPAGFQVELFAEGLGDIRMMAVGEDGTIYITRPDGNDVIALRDADGDGQAEAPQTVVENLDRVHGIALHDGKMWLATVRGLYVAEMTSGTAGMEVGEPREIFNDLPEGGNHPNRTLGFGPDGNLYITVGSTCNACVERNPESATILRASPNGENRQIFARGLRNTIGFGWHPATGELWGMDHGSDWLGDNFPPEELNRIVEGGDYGWPYVYGPEGRIPDGVDTSALSNPQTYPATTKKLVLAYQAHSSPLQMTFYTGNMFPREYANDAFVAMRGSWNRAAPSGYEIARIDFDATGQPLSMEPFITGFHVDGEGAFARPTGIAVAKDGSLLVGDDQNGNVYRISYSDPATPSASLK